jgi:hypothetical protein
MIYMTLISPCKCTPSNCLQLLITELYRLLGLLPEPIRLADSKAVLLCHYNGGIQLCSSRDLLQKTLWFLVSDKISVPAAARSSCYGRISLVFGQ